MRRIFVLMVVLAAPGAVHAMDCSTGAAQPIRSTVLAPVASELIATTSPLGTSGGVLSDAYDEAQSVDQVLLRIRIESCQNVAMATPAPSVVSPDNPAAYKPRTQFDNTPWRFNMSQNGKNMTADEFSAWMKSRGVRVARGNNAQAPVVSATVIEPTAAPATTPAPEPPPTVSPTPPQPR